jgi:hypothetical protein
VAAAIGPRQTGSNHGIAQVATVRQLHIGINPLVVLVGLYGRESDNLASVQGARVVPRLYRSLDLFPAPPLDLGNVGIGEADSIPAGQDFAL